MSIINESVVDSDDETKNRPKILDGFSGPDGI